MDKQNMKVLIIERNKSPTVKIITNKLEALRRIIGNERIEVVKYENSLLIFDEDAYRKREPINRILNGINIRGTFILSGNDNKNQDFKDLSEEQIQRYIKEFELEKEVEQEGEEMEE